MADSVLMSKATIVRRLVVTIPKKGMRPPTLEIRLRDIAAHLRMSAKSLEHIAQGRRDMNDELQVQLSAFFVLVERGLMVKVRDGDVYRMQRVARAAGVAEPARATIDVRGLAPRIHWSF
jgi:hypothetical protein